MRRLVVTACAAVLVAGKFVASAVAAQPPNVVLVLADQWRAQALACAGDPNVRTPHLDRLSKESCWFVNAVSNVPVCCPARASLLTGQRVLTHGVFLNDVPLNPQATTLPKVLATAGYDTAYIGKWHLNGQGRSNFIPRERRQGFDYWKALECTHDYNHSPYFGDTPEKLMWKGYDAIAQTDDAIEYLRGRRGDKPFFLMLAWGPPHDPYQTAPEEYRALYAPEKIQLRPNVPAEFAAKARQMAAGYYAHCTALDTCVGKLREALAERGLAENTIFLFSSDHGDMLGSHAGVNKQQPFDESIRIPLFITWPQGLGRDCRKYASLISIEDFMPTLLGLCGVAVPKTVEGLDFSGQLRGGKAPGDGAAVIACQAPFGQWTRERGGREYRGLRTERYTYVRDLNGPWLLFDNQTDPYQQNNLVGKAEQAALQAELDARLMARLETAGDEFRPAADYIGRWGYKVDRNGTVPYGK